MFPRFSTSSVTIGWLLGLLVALWIMSGTASTLGWLAFVALGLIAPLVLLMLTRTPARTTAEIIRDVDGGRS